MEKKNARSAAPETEFANHLALAKQGNEGAVLILLAFFEEDIRDVIRYVRTDLEDTRQSIALELIELFKSADKE